MPFTTFVPAATGVVTVGIFTGIVLIVRWGLSAQRRVRRTQSIASHPLKFLAPRNRGESVFLYEEQLKLPMVSMVMPVKWAAIKSRSPKENWKSQLVSMYSGSIEAIFAVETEDDGAVQVVKELQEELAHLEGVTIKVAVAGPATTCSQKIANILAALRAVSPESRYIFCMDANCKLHPGTVHLLMNELENDTSVFVATGYPFDMPPENASIWARRRRSQSRHQPPPDATALCRVAVCAVHGLLPPRL